MTKNLLLNCVVYYHVPTSNHNLPWCVSWCVSVVYYHVPTSNHNPFSVGCHHEAVVYYHVPTSNHNPCFTRSSVDKVVYYHVPTSNHNVQGVFINPASLYIIMFLHQTTTAIHINLCLDRLYIIMFLHQTTTYPSLSFDYSCCILSCSYIKPQLMLLTKLLTIVVYYHVPTSNHNGVANSQ